MTAAHSSRSERPTEVGTVQDVSGPTVGVALTEATLSGLIFIDGQGYRVGQVGSFVRIPIGFVDLYGIVSQVGASAVPENRIAEDPHGHRWLRVQLVGEALPGEGFSRGLSQYPTIGDTVHLVTDRELKAIYAMSGGTNHVAIGKVAGADSISAALDANRLIARHCAIVGSTGSGKSTTVATVLRALSDSATLPGARIVVLDIHGEYSKALADRANTLRVTADPDPSLPNQLRLPYWALSLDEFLPLAFGALDDSSRASVSEKITQLKANTLSRYPVKGVDADHVTADSAVPFSVHQLWLDLHRLVNATHSVAGTGQSRQTEALLLDDKNKIVQPGDALKVIPPKYQPQVPSKVFLSGSNLNIRRQLDALASKLRDPRMNFLFRPGGWLPDADGKTAEDLDSWVKSMIGSSEPITVLDLSGIPAQILSDLVGALLRILYDAVFWGRNLSEGGRERPLLFVLEEAHVYLNGDARGSAPSSARRIAKEGRKYGVGLMLVSQRPAEVDPTILSQCGTIISLRLSNAADRSHVVSAVSDNLEGLLAMLPILRTGEAIIVGEAVPLPMRTLIAKPPAPMFPDSRDPRVVDIDGAGGWTFKPPPSTYNDLVEAWRSQSPRVRNKFAKEKSMNRIQVSSSNVTEFGYDPATQLLEIVFKNGHTYQYFDVPQTVADQLTSLAQSGGSVGTAVNQLIRGNYRYSRV